MAKEVIENAKFEEILKAIPAGKFFGSYISTMFEDFANVKIELNDADLDVENKKLSLDFTIKDKDNKYRFKIGTSNEDGVSCYYMGYEEDDMMHTLTYKVEAA
jgi:hypothetical protein